MNIVKSFMNLTKLELIIWVSSLLLITGSFILFNTNDYLTVLASLIGATALIFVGKGDALGQLLTMVFAIVYAVISYQCHYYGEMITYVGMSLPSAFVAMIEWLRHPYDERTVEVSELSVKKWVFLCVSSVIVTIGFGYILVLFNTSQIVLSTISITTSYFASMLTIYRSPYYAIAYCFNDIVLICLWVLVSIMNINFIPMIICFIIFLVNDFYGYIRWKKMKTIQKETVET